MCENEFIDVAITTTKLYNSINKKLKEKGYRLELWFQDNIDLANEIYVYHQDLLHNYKPDRGSLINWLCNTLPNRLIRQYGGFTDDISDIEEEIDINIEPSNKLRILKPAFGRMYFLNDYQKELAEAYYNKEASVKALKVVFNKPSDKIRRDIRNINEKLNQYLRFVVLSKKQKKELEELLNNPNTEMSEKKKLKEIIDSPIDPLKLFLYCVASDKHFNKILNNNLMVSYCVYSKGYGATKTAKELSISPNTFYKELEESKNKLRLLFSEELEYMEVIIDLIKDI